MEISLAFGHKIGKWEQKIKRHDFKHVKKQHHFTC